MMQAGRPHHNGEDCRRDACATKAFDNRRGMSGRLLHGDALELDRYLGVADLHIGEVPGPVMLPSLPKSNST